MKMALTVEHVISMYRRSKQVQFLGCKFKKKSTMYTCSMTSGHFTLRVIIHWWLLRVISLCMGAIVHSGGHYTPGAILHSGGTIVHSDTAIVTLWMPLYTLGAIDFPFCSPSF